MIETNRSPINGLTLTVGTHIQMYLLNVTCTCICLTLIVVYMHSPRHEQLCNLDFVFPKLKYFPLNLLLRKSLYFEINISSFETKRSFHDSIYMCVPMIF